MTMDDIRTEIFATGTDDDSLKLAAQRGATLAEIESAYMAHVLELVDGNKAQAARILGIDRRTLYRKLGSTDEQG